MPKTAAQKEIHSKTPVSSFPRRRGKDDETGVFWSGLKLQ
ncbi:hypothetical protein HMPREF1051_2549 [Neisseria sicca VK64]|uniref:Uncharacterized protein n=1 Tax=Neisseria sicca VK64 TaxID=1095748 RepID=I2NUP9_NEISI|nr:hypothetical protein HMPREF1051_2549 [Neisseria sicca VK64]